MRAGNSVIMDGDFDVMPSRLLDIVESLKIARLSCGLHSP